MFSTENAAAAVGVIALLAMIAAALIFFIPSGIAHAKWEWLSKEVFETEYGVDGMVRSRKEKHQPSFVMNIILGVVIILAGGIAICAAALKAVLNRSCALRVLTAPKQIMTLISRIII